MNYGCVAVEPVLSIAEQPSCQDSGNKECLRAHTMFNESSSPTATVNKFRTSTWESTVRKDSKDSKTILKQEFAIGGPANFTGSTKILEQTLGREIATFFMPYFLNVLNLFSVDEVDGDGCVCLLTNVKDDALCDTS
ncbi:hypothetical protein SELMODRAFT_406425 [Selaginella moellendorffii]|uniref:Uncharacterized protein n=1 Tax=Selaginella moellendorffii TaxID=88036 RepID=D8R2B8_SELML|nr:hypothetical protein SELMODRAFT_406425 [Selaginella moellendorffii]